jgi:hypothetical protein
MPKHTAYDWKASTGSIIEHSMMLTVIPQDQDNLLELTWNKNVKSKRHVALQAG